MSHFVDPSWCARLHAASSSAGRPAASDPVASAAPDTSAPPASSAVPGDEGAAEEARAPLFVKREIPSVHECELCGTVMFDHNCKIICPNCGYKRDCSDP
ncbi:hypothetical protein [Longimicrobium terrae]|uniref:Ribosomal protein L32 n=1 Tax=Longimicrobium terrae TaxID=1639882 RepID=A0A841H5J3_9BACT|nr:hypothetical protein [Longimicrobium terrae]MBB4639069.1 ribosomal protein L32 [Longimicrobium terrae]MBB6073330.1 ribosomal protein L32 [Longimicrobium terrae]NNC28769.1 hypothetical protein [Longimicrobium terrae]